MFDLSVLPQVEQVCAVDTAALIDAVGGTARMESAVMARRLAAVAELFNRRLAAADDQQQWLIDGAEEVNAEVAAAMGISRARAAGIVRVAHALQARLPKVAALFADGRVDYRVVSAIVSRTGLIIDDDDVRRIDAVLARRAPRWARLSDNKLRDVLDRCVVEVDMLAKKPPRSADDEREVGLTPDRHGMAELWGTVRASDGVAFVARLDQLADSVCSADPRTRAQRRADATGAMAARAERLQCLCGRQDCPAAGTGPATAPEVVVTVITDCEGKPAYIPGFGFFDQASMAAIAAAATKRTVAHPGQAKAEQGYRPSAALAEFVRCRDLTCRFPGCDARAQVCDIDHTVPWPLGPTHPSNLKLLCRYHHLLKTFYTGADWWGDRQLPDGTVIWTSPTGHTYTTKPDGALFFPILATPTGKLILPEQAGADLGGRGMMMPKRARTRTAEEQARITYQRRLNAEALRAQPPPEHDPPPF